MNTSTKFALGSIVTVITAATLLSQHNQASATVPSNATTANFLINQVNTTVSAIGVSQITGSLTRTYAQFCNTSTQTPPTVLYIHIGNDQSSVPQGNCFTVQDDQVGSSIFVFASSSPATTTKAVMSLTLNP